jgi:hypothetical protein
MLFTGLPELENAAGIAASPAVMIGIMASPLPAARAWMPWPSCMNSGR